MKFLVPMMMLGCAVITAVSTGSSVQRREYSIAATSALLTIITIVWASALVIVANLT